MAQSACSVKVSPISSAFISKEGNEILSSMKAPRYVDYINTLFGNVFQREYLDNNSYVTLSDFTDEGNKTTVGGNLNNLYSKVKEELVNQINSNFVNTLPNETIEGLQAILDNWKLFVDFHSKYNAYVAIRDEDLAEKEDNNYDKKGNEHTEFSLLTNEVRTIFKFFPQSTLIRNSEGELIGVPVISPVDGLPIRGDFENIFKLTLDAMKGIKDEAKFIEKLGSEEVLTRIPELSFLFNILPVRQGTNNLTNKQRLLFHQFFQVMSRDYIPVFASSVTQKKDALPTHIRYQSAKSNLSKIKRQFISNFISNQDENDYVKIDNTVDDKVAENSVYGRKRIYALPAKLPLINLTNDEINSLTPRRIKKEFTPYFDFFKLLGVEFSDYSLLSNKKNLIDVLNSALPIHDNITMRLSKGQKIFNPLQELEKPLPYIEVQEKDGKKTVLNKSVGSLRTTFRNVLKFEGTISKISPTLVTKAANGENQSDITYSNAISIAAQQINDSNSLEDLYTKPYFKKLKYNPLHKTSFVGTRVVGNKNISYAIENYSGYTITDLEDNSTSSDTKSLSDIDKFTSDFNNLMGWGTINTPQLESKAGYFAVKFVDNSTDKPIIPFAQNQFTQDFITNSDFGSQIIHYLHGEIERVRTYPSVKNYAPVSYGEFFIFKNFITPELKEALLKDKNSTDYKKAETAVLQGMNTHFNQEVFQLENFIKKNNINNFISEKVLSEAKINEQVFKDNKEAYTQSLLRAFVANDFIHNVEFGIYVSGDPLFYKDYHKRLGGLSSTGTQPVATNNLREFFNSDSEKIFWDNFSLRGILNQLGTDKTSEQRRDNFETFLSAVMQEDNVTEGTEYQKPETIANYIYSVKLNTGREITKEQAEADLKIDQIAKKGIDVGDGQGYLNLDAARELSIKQGTYRPQQDVSYKFEALIFKQMLLQDRGQELEEDEQKLLKKLEGQILRNPDKYALPTLKQSYYGTIANESVKIDAKIFDKFSLAIILPSTARNHPKQKELLLAMAKRQIHYVKYKSGTKGFVRDTFKDIKELADSKNELDELQSNLLKLQIPPSKTEKTSTKIPTQKIKLLFTNLFDEGNASESVKNLRNAFLNDLNNIKSYNRKNILKKLGFELDENQNITTWDKGRIIDALVSQVNLQKLPTPLLEALETDDQGNFTNTLESSNIYQQVLNYVSGKLDSTLREFKVNGGDFVLLSESMYDTPLAYFRLNANKTAILSCDCRITMTKEYAKMLNLPDFENPNQTIGSVERINQLLKIPAFKEKYKKELSIVFSRPPVQGPNSMGVATITEFFYPTAGNILQLPKEFMHQAGIDFDYDKEKVLIPSLTDEGYHISEENLKTRERELRNTEYFKNLLGEAKDAQKLFNYLSIELDDFDTEDDFEQAKTAILEDDNVLKLMNELFQTPREDIESNLQDIKREISNYLNIKNKQKSLLSNSLFQTIKQSLQQPEIYSELILPNTDATVKPLALENGKDINNLNTLPQGVDVYSYQQNLKVFKLFNDAKALLGPFALHNVFMELIAPLNVKANLDYAFDKDGKPTRRVNLLLSENKSRTISISSRYDEEGNIKQHITSEFINATVDSAKDPYFANFMLSFDNINIFTYMMALGYPVKKIVDFTSSAIVRRYLTLKSKGFNREQATMIALNEVVPNTMKTPPSIEDILTVDQYGLDKDNSELIKRLKEFKSDDSLANKANYSYLRAILTNFVAMEVHSKQFRNFKNLYKNDTTKTSSLYEISSKQSLKRNVISNGMFNASDVANVEDHSTMTAFRNDDLIGQVLNKVFPIMSNPIVSDGLGNLFNDAKPGLNDVDKRILSQVITNDYITGLLYTFGTYKNENFFEYGQKLVTKTKAPDGTLNTTLLERIFKFKQNKAYPDLIKQFPVLDKILGEVSDKPVKGNLVYRDKYAFGTRLNIDPNIPIIEKEAFMGQFKQIFEEDFTTENPMVKAALINLVKDFFIAGLIQSGFNKGGISYLEYAPVKFIQDLLNPALKQYNYAEKTNPAFIEAYVKNFTSITPDPNSNLFKRNNSKYFFIPKEYKGTINKSSYLGKYLYVPNVIAPAKQATSNEIKAIIPQNLVSGTEAFGTKQEATDQVKAILGANPHSIDMIEAGLRTRTTRSVGEMEKYNIKVGDVIKHSGKSSNGTIKEVLSRVTAIYPKGSPEFESTWYKEGWTQEGISAIQRYKDGAAAIEFELINQPNINDNNLNKTLEIQAPYPGVLNIPNTGLSVQQADAFIDLLRGQIANQAYVENKAKTANRMFSFGLRWAKNVPNPTEKSKQKANGLIQRPDRVPIKSKNDYTYGYYKTDQNNNPLPALEQLQPIIDFIESKLGIDMSNYDSVLANIYENNSFIHQHRDITESVTAANYPVIVLNLGAKGGLIYDPEISNQDINSTDAYARFKGTATLPIDNGGIYAFGVNGVNRFTFSHRIEDSIGETPTQPIKVPIWNENGEKDGETTLQNYRITLTFRRAQDLASDMSIAPENILDQATASIEEKTEQEAQVESQQDTGIINEVGTSIEDTLGTTEEPVIPATLPIQNKKEFSYKGKTIETEFELGEQQKEALENLIDFVNSSNRFITLQGAAGTGKTTIIGYLQKYMQNKASFAYMAPTHAATAELAFATVKTGSTVLPSTLQSSLTTNPKTKRSVFTQKIQKRVGFNPVFILDESSMIDQSDITRLDEALDDFGGKLIFLGDEKQISKVQPGNSLTKNVSPAFSAFNQVMLTKIYRQSDNSLLNLLGEMRQQNDFKLFKVENSDVVKFLNRADFGRELTKDLASDPQNTVVVTYTNNSVKGTNTNIRTALGRTGDPIPDDIIVGYLGYASKQIEKKDIANSIQYKLTEVRKEGSAYALVAESAKLQNLVDLGIEGVSNRATTMYYQLDRGDSLAFKDLNQLDFDKNNEEVSKVFRRIYNSGIRYQEKQITYQTYLGEITAASEDLRKVSVGADYIFNPFINKMEKYDPIKHKTIKNSGQGSLLMNKDIDYGHAITIHKSQGSTIDNVYFDSSSLQAASNTPIIDTTGKQITTEKMSLAYVAMSRSKKKLVVYEGENQFEFLKSPQNVVPSPDLDDIGFKKSCN